MDTGITAILEQNRDKKLALNQVFGEYPSSFFIVEPIIDGDSSNDFMYRYVNNAFCMFLGRQEHELVGHSFVEAFGENGEPFWLALFYDVATKKQVQYVNKYSSFVDRYLSVEAFYVDPGMCGCIIRDFSQVDEKDELTFSDALLEKAYYDPLTGVFNRICLQENEKRLSKEKNIGISFFDINDLNSINCNQGRKAGDTLIIDFVAELKKIFSRSLIFRVGGDEFVVISKKQKKETYLGKAEKFTKKLTKSGLAAMGYGFYEEINDIWEEINECDQLMYDHKREMKAGVFSQEY